MSLSVCSHNSVFCLGAKVGSFSDISNVVLAYNKSTSKSLCRYAYSFLKAIGICLLMLEETPKSVVMAGVKTIAASSLLPFVQLPSNC